MWFNIGQQFPTGDHCLCFVNQHQNSLPDGYIGQIQNILKISHLAHQGRGAQTFIFYFFSILLSYWVRWWKGNRCTSDSELCLCSSARGFTVTPHHLHPPTEGPGRPPVPRPLGPLRLPVCQLVDICLLPPPSVVMAATEPLPQTPTTPSPTALPHPRPAARLHYTATRQPPSTPAPPRHQLWSNYACPVVHLMLSCHIKPAPPSLPFSNSLRNCPSSRWPKKQTKKNNNGSFKSARFDCVMCPKCGRAFACCQMRYRDKKISPPLNPSSVPLLLVCAPGNGSLILNFQICWSNTLMFRDCLHLKAVFFFLFFFF